MYIDQYAKSDRLLIATDCILFGYDGKQLNVLLIKRGFEPGLHQWSLMGGFVQQDESIENAASRILIRLTGLSNIYMEQLHSFGDVNRDQAGRVVSIAYFALIKINEYTDQLSPDHEAHWFPLNECPELIFDHLAMITMAKEQLMQKAAIQPIGFELLPEKFTLPQLQGLYEAIYETPIDRRNFSRKILSLDILKKLDEKEKQSSKKGAFYYVFDYVKYNKLKTERLKFI